MTPHGKHPPSAIRALLKSHAAAALRYASRLRTSLYSCTALVVCFRVTVAGRRLTFYLTGTFSPSMNMCRASEMMPHTLLLGLWMCMVSQQLLVFRALVRPVSFQAIS